MTVRQIRLGDDLYLPAEEFIESVTAIVAKRKSGKSGAVKVIAEEAVRLGLPFVLFDPVGVHWGIRSSFDGTKPGLKVLVIGGEHRDIELNRKKGAEVAKAIVEANISVVIDFRGEPKAAYREFIRDFSQELLRINNSPRLVIIEEAPELVPQKIRSDQAPTYDAVEALVRLGRNQGIGVVLVGQRPATINKDVLTQIDTMLIGRLLSPQDRKAIREWVEVWDLQDQLPEFEKGLADLPTQTLWLWSPEALKQFRPVKIRKFKTLHADKTHLRRMGLLAIQPASADIAGVVEKLGPILKEAARPREDVAALRERIRTLEARTTTDTRIKASAKEIGDAFTQGQTQGTRESRDRIRELERATREYAHWEAYRLLPAVNALRKNLDILEHTIENAPTRATAIGGARIVRPVTIPEPSLPGHAGPVRSPMRPGPESSHPMSPAVMPRTRNGDGSPDDQIVLKSGARRMLGELASRHPATFTYSQLATLAGFTPSGGTATNYFSTLRRAGYIDEDAEGNVRITPSGLEVIGTNVPPPATTHGEVMGRWARSLKAGCYRMLEVVAEAHPDSITRDDLADRTGFAVTGGTFSNYLGILVRNGLVTTERNGPVKAAGILWP